MPPATAMWLSLIRMASSRPKRWLKPPPQRTAYFSSARKPGVVLRVQMMRALVCAIRATKAAVAVAMPERWPRKLSATRSAPRIARALPEIVISLAPRWTPAPSRPCGAIAISGASRRNAAATSGSPAITPASRTTTSARPPRSSGMVAIEVMSPARPRSSSSARVTAASISSGERKASARNNDAKSVGSGGIDVRAVLAAKSIVTAANYGKPHDDGPGTALRSPGGTAMQRTTRHLVIFILAIQIEPLCCAAFESQVSLGRHERRIQDIGQLAHADTRHRFRQPDSADRLRATLHAGIFLDPAFQC